MHNLVYHYDIVDGIPRFVYAEDRAGSHILRPESLYRLSRLSSSILTDGCVFPPSKILDSSGLSSKQYAAEYAWRCTALGECFSFATVSGLGAALSIPRDSLQRAFGKPSERIRKDLRQQSALPWITNNQSRTKHVDTVYVELEYTPIALYQWLRIDALMDIRRGIIRVSKRLRGRAVTEVVQRLLEMVGTRIVSYDLALEKTCDEAQNSLTSRRYELEKLLERGSIPIIPFRYERELRAPRNIGSAEWITMGAVTFNRSKSAISKLHSKELSLSVRGYGLCAGLLDVIEPSEASHYGFLFDPKVPRCPLYPAPLLPHEPFRPVQTAMLKHFDDVSWLANLRRALGAAANRFPELRELKTLSKFPY